MERENLAGDAKGKGASGSNREAESTGDIGARYSMTSSAVASRVGVTVRPSILAV